MHIPRMPLFNFRIDSLPLGTLLFAVGCSSAGDGPGLQGDASNEQHRASEDASEDAALPTTDSARLETGFEPGGDGATPTEPGSASDAIVGFDGATGGAFPAYWGMVGASADSLYAADATHTAAMFDNPRTAIGDSAGNKAAKLPNTVGWWYGDSYAGFAAAVAAGKVVPGAVGAKYDNEDWPGTPTSERSDVATTQLYMKKFCDLAHAQHLLCIVAPSPNIVKGYPGHDTFGADIWAQYVAMGVPTAVGNSGADVFDLQAQHFEADAAGYAKWVAQVQALSKKVAPSQAMMVNLSTNHGTADQMYAAAEAVAPSVAGFWLNVPQATGISIAQALVVKWLAKPIAVGVAWPPKP
ncbi:MAG: hypothetical protein NVS3B20_01710 [Polyangiales bacterium]